MGKGADLTGRVFGRWTVLRRLLGGRWACRCKCGTEGSPITPKLTSGRSKSCGCLRVNGDHINALSLTGQTFGRWTVLERVEEVHAGGHYAWTCRCECGDVLASALTSGSSRSCGCLRVELTAQYKTKHGAARRGHVTPEFSTWNSMMNRCESDRHNYGGRGIYVCPRWQNFLLFREDMGPRPVGTSIDRVLNATGSYTCGKCDDCIARGATMNCRWATPAEQSRNQRSNVLITYQGETLPLCDWAPRFGMPVYLLRGRLRDGWSMERAATTPKGPYERSGKFAKTTEAA